MAHYIDYYNGQIGSGGSPSNTGINRVYIGTPYQRGSGIGSFLGGLFRSILPLFTRGAKAVGKEAWRTGINVLSDVALNSAPVKESLRTHARESVGNLKRKAEDQLDKYLMEGSGYKLKHPALSSHLLNTLGTLSTGQKKRLKKKKKKRSVKKKTNSKGIKKRKNTRKKVQKKKKKRTSKKRTSKNLAADIFS